jgi:hypothetical protein
MPSVWGVRTEIPPENVTDLVAVVVTIAMLSGNLRL